MTGVCFIGAKKCLTPKTGFEYINIVVLKKL